MRRVYRDGGLGHFLRVGILSNASYDPFKPVGHGNGTQNGRKGHRENKKREGRQEIPDSDDKNLSARQGQKNPGRTSTVTLMEVGWEEGDGYEKT